MRPFLYFHNNFYRFILKSMDITKRIEKVKEYFIKFNIDDEAITLALKFPTKWAIPNAEFLKEQYNVVAGATPYGVIYATELANGFEKIFDAVEYTIRFNMEAQERLTLLNEKVEELKKLFVGESLEKLRTLNFVFDKKKKAPQTKDKGLSAMDALKKANAPEQNANKIENAETNDDSVLLAAKEIMTEQNKA